MQLSQTGDTFVNEDRRWLYGLHGTDDTFAETLDATAFGAVQFPDGIVKSGTRLGRVTATGLAVPYDNAASDGSQTCIGLLFTTQRILPGGRPSVPVLKHGKVFRDRLPFGVGSGSNVANIDAAGEADLPQITFLTS